MRCPAIPALNFGRGIHFYAVVAPHAAEDLLETKIGTSLLWLTIDYRDAHLQIGDDFFLSTAGFFQLGNVLVLPGCRPLPSQGGRCRHQRHDKATKGQR